MRKVLPEGAPEIHCQAWNSATLPPDPQSDRCTVRAEDFTAMLAAAEVTMQANRAECRHPFV
jgi:hypothetical protein